MSAVKGKALPASGEAYAVLIKPRRGLIGMMLYYGIVPTSAVWMLPLYLLLTLVTALGVGLWLAALNVHYRDVRHIIPFLTQFWMLATPIAFQANEIFDRLPDGLDWL